MQNNIQQELVSLGLVNLDNVVSYYPQVRDNPNIAVLKCLDSNIIFLQNNAITESYYHQKSGVTYWNSESREHALKKTEEDDMRRVVQFKDEVLNKSYMDVGTGLGGMLDKFKPYAKTTCAIEPQSEIREHLQKLNYKVIDSIDSCVSQNIKVDVVSLFHVFEHLTTPLEDLKKLYDSLTLNGKIIIEVPHAEDVLLSAYQLEAFKKFTFWSEHLILHTRESLYRYLEVAGFKNIIIKGYQRYPLANHIGWLKDGKPGGHLNLSYLRTQELDNAYSTMLQSINKTDTLIAIAEKK